MKTTLPIADLVEDLSVYPRHAVDEANVTSLVRALESGATLPPIVVDKASKRIVDGIHRGRAYRRVLGAAGAVDVDLRSYKDEASLLLDAVAMNAVHGRQFDAIDRTRAVLMLEKQGVETLKIAAALHIPEAHVQKIKVRVATATHMSDQTVPGTRRIVLKRPVHHLAGTKLTDEQVDAHSRAPGVSYLLLTRQLTEGLRTHLLNLEDAKLMDALRDLHDELTAQFV